MKANLTIASVLLGIVLIAAFVNTNRAAVRDMGAPAETSTVRGDLKVSYETITRQGDSAEQINPVTGEACSEIDLHEQYVVLKYKAGGGRVLPVDQFRNLRWEGR